MESLLLHIDIATIIIIGLIEMIAQFRFNLCRHILIMNDLDDVATIHYIRLLNYRTSMSNSLHLNVSKNERKV